MDAEQVTELARLRDENASLRGENALYRRQLEDMVKRFEAALSLLRVVSGSRVADLVEQQKLPESKDP